MVLHVPTMIEVRRFKHSAAKATTMERSLPGLSTSSSSLVQVIVDNFDTDISSPNGKSSTHSLAMLLTQPDSNSSETVQEDTIRRVKKENMVEPLEYDVEIKRYKEASDATEHPHTISSALAYAGTTSNFKGKSQ